MVVMLFDGMFVFSGEGGGVWVGGGGVYQFKFIYYMYLLMDVDVGEDQLLVLDELVIVVDDVELEMFVLCLIQCLLVILRYNLCNKFWIMLGVFLVVLVVVVLVWLVFISGCCGFSMFFLVKRNYLVIVGKQSVFKLIFLWWKYFWCFFNVFVKLLFME